MLSEYSAEVERGRVVTGKYASRPGDRCGKFIIPLRLKGARRVHLHIIAGTGFGWDHVSVSLRCTRRAPTWDEMCAVKDLFFDAEECVIQYHPPRSVYVQRHPYCLHLWKPHNHTIPMPLPIMV